ncbi:hypothetical protein PIB30_003530 [Stylosanthes scabra]|uniref:Uncharacterized protein n=1 Tax=Stylosanthes scabra TaxID=79078 RepID=A0ABU6W1K8_9FABA|nr:hypothetical protein [Stylosanthes scabra]
MVFQNLAEELGQLRENERRSAATAELGTVSLTGGCAKGKTGDATETANAKKKLDRKTNKPTHDEGTGWRPNPRAGSYRTKKWGKSASSAATLNTKTSPPKHIQTG